MTADDDPRPRKRSRPNAWRSCRTCKERKQRCELPGESMLLDPSDEPLDEQQACARCHVMGMPCLLDDFDKVARIAIERRKRSRIGSSHTGEKWAEQGTGADQLRNPPEIDSSPSIRSASTRSAAHSMMQLSTPSSTAMHLTPTAAATSHSDRSPLDAASTGPRTHSDDLDEFKRFSLRSRPITLVSELAVRQPNFASLAPELASLARESIIKPESIDDLIDAQLSNHLSVWCEMHLQVWLPGLPAPSDIRRARRHGHPISASMRLLEAAQYLVAIQHSSSSSAQALQRQTASVQLARMVELYLARCLLGSQRDLHAAQALELLSVFPLASAYLDRAGSGKVDTLEVSLLVSASRRIASACRQEYISRKMQNRSKVGVNGLQMMPADEQSIDSLREMELGVAWCSTTAWEFCHCMGSDDVILSYAVRHMPKMEEVQRLINFSRDHPVPGPAGLGHAFVLLRSHLLANAVIAWEELCDLKPAVLGGRARDAACSDDRMRDLGQVIKSYEQRGLNSRALRYSWFENHTDPEAQVLLQWLDIEDQSCFNLLAGIAIYYAIQSDNCRDIRQFTPEFLYSLIQGVGVEECVRTFIFKYGDDRLDTAESMLMVATTLASVDLTSKDGVTRDLIVPPVATCGFMMEACMLSMEVHATTAKFWKSLPRRSRPWQAGMKGAASFLRRMHDVSEEEGGVFPTTWRIIGGMLEVISTWDRALSRARIAQSRALQSQIPSYYDANGTTEKASSNGYGQSKAATLLSDQDGGDTHDSRVAGVDVAIPPLATDDENVSLDQLLRDMFGSTEWADVLSSVSQM